MRKLLFIFIILSLLVSCTKQEESQEPQSSLIDEYVENMDEYEILEIAFLGVLNSQRSLQDIIDRVKDFDDLKIAAEILKESTPYGNTGENTNVYLIIPNKNVDITVGKYNCDTMQMEDIWLKSEDCKPFLYYEEVTDSLNPSGIIEFVKDGEYGNLLTGFSLDQGELRTAFKMGIVDTTPYEIFTSAEIPFYDQAFFDVLMSIDEVVEKTSEGMTLHKMGETNYQGKYYAVYYLSDSNDDTYKCYAINFGTNSLSVLESLDFINWIEILKY